MARTEYMHSYYLAHNGQGRTRNNIRPECGTRAGYRWHLWHGEPTCKPCRAAHAARKSARGATPEEAAAFADGARRRTRPGAWQHCTRWDAEQLAIIRREDIGTEQKALLVGRTYSAVNTKRHRMGYSSVTSM